MGSDLEKQEPFPLVVPPVMATAESAIAIYICTLMLVIILWLYFCYHINFAGLLQLILTLALMGIMLGSRNSAIIRSEIDLKAKGLDIRDRYLDGIMPWDWLVKFEIRQRNWSIFPNYVYFQFKDRSDCLILWEDVADTMDSSTLVSCVRTWAPHAEIHGDVNLMKSESIATYTELWLKGINSHKIEKRQRKDQVLTEGTVLSDSYEVKRILSGGGQGTFCLGRNFLICHRKW